MLSRELPSKGTIVGGKQYTAAHSNRLLIVGFDFAVTRITRMVVPVEPIAMKEKRAGSYKVLNKLKA